MIESRALISKEITLKEVTLTLMIKSQNDLDEQNTGLKKGGY